MTNLDSKTISMLRFPLIVGVVCIHARAVNPDLWGGIFQNLLGVEIGSISVPLFLIISGYLFFLELPDILKREDYLKKWKSRCRSLLVPYLLWNFIAYIVYAVQSGFSLSDFFHAFWVIDIPGRTGSSPIDGPLWYVRNLMLMVLITPLISVMLRFTKWYLLALMAFLWLFQLSVFSKGIGIAFFFFSLGGFLRMQRFSVEKLRFGSLILIGYIIYVIVTISYGYYGIVVLTKLRLLMGIYSAIYLSSLVAKRGKEIVKGSFLFLAESSFFIYCCHDIILPFVKYLLYNGTSTSIVQYLSVILIDIIFCLLLFYFLNKCFPSVSKLLTGGR